MESQLDIFGKMLQGDEKSLGLLLDLYHNYLVVVGMRYLTDRQRVDDVIHDVFADLWNKRTEVNITCGVKSYLRGAVVNKCLAIIRKESRIELKENVGLNLIDRSPTPEQIIDGKILKEEIDKIVSELPEKCQQVFLLSRRDGKSHQEISDEMGISKKTIENHMTRALKTLKESLKRKELFIMVYILIKMNFN